MPRRRQTAFTLAGLGLSGALLASACLLLPDDGGGPPTAPPEVQTVIAAYPELGSWEDRLTREAEAQTQIARAYPHALTARFETPPPLDPRGLTATLPPAPQPTFTPVPWLTPTPLLPTLDPTQLAGLLPALRQEMIPAANGRSLTRLTGWAAGLRSSGYCLDGPYRWLDDDHLLLYPITGLEEGMGVIEYTQPVVASLSGKPAWQPPTDGPISGCGLPLWSEALSGMIAVAGDEVALLTADGERRRQFNNTLAPYYAVSLSPSGKRLVTGLSWHDLETGQSVELTPADGFEAHRWSFYAAGWSKSENRLFKCCFLYADAVAGTSASFHVGQLALIGRGLPPGFSGLSSRWVLDDTRVMVEWDFSDGELSVIPLIDPVERRYQDVRALAGLPAEGYCGVPSIAPDGNRLVVACGEQYLIDLRRFAAQMLPEDYAFVSWSPDSRFVLLSQEDSPAAPLNAYLLVATENGETLRLADSPLIAPAWAPQGARLAFLRADGQALIMADLNAATVFQATLPARARQVVWDRQGESLAVVAEDGSLGWVPDPAVDRVEQMTSPLSEVRDWRWSPSGARLAFVSGPDVYVVDMAR